MTGVQTCALPIWFVFCFIFFFIYKGHIGVRRSGALPLRPSPIVWRHKITDAPPAKRRSICSDHIFVARIGVLHQVGQCHAVQVFADHTVQLVPQRIGAAFRHARAGRGTFFQAGNSCQAALRQAQNAAHGVRFRRAGQLVATALAAQTFQKALSDKDRIKKSKNRLIIKSHAQNICEKSLQNQNIQK